MFNLGSFIQELLGGGKEQEIQRTGSVQRARGEQPDAQPALRIGRVQNAANPQAMQQSGGIPLMGNASAAVDPRAPRVPYGSPLGSPPNQDPSQMFQVEQAPRDIYQQAPSIAMRPKFDPTRVSYPNGLAGPALPDDPDIYDPTGRYNLSRPRF